MNKRGLRAISIGILLAVSVIGSDYYIFEKKDNKPLDQQTAKTLLQKEGYVVLSAEDYKKVKMQTRQKNTNSEIQTQANTLNKKQVENEELTYQLQIVSGVSSGEIAKLLVENHIIENENEFAQYMITHHFQTKIQLGTFSLSNTMSYDQIAKIITKTK